MSRKEIKVGDVFERLTIISEPYSKLSKNKARRRVYVKAICECGNEGEYDTDHLKSKHTRSCGCLANDETRSRSTIHGLCRANGEEPLYRIWRHIKERCNNPNDSHFKYYGGRGILMCEEWTNSPEIFFKWATNNEYETGKQIDRIDNDGNYEPSNCRFVTPKENSRNRRTTKITIDIANKIREEYGEGSLNKSKLAKKYNLNTGTIWYIVNNKQWT